jgi:hypothetical protein
MTKEETMQSSLIIISKDEAYSSSSFSIYSSYIDSYYLNYDLGNQEVENWKYYK